MIHRYLRQLALLLKLWLAAISCLGSFTTRADNAADLFQPGSVVAFVGGADVVGMLASGHFESGITAAFPERNLKFRNFGWEGDTVYEQPRDINFPPLLALLIREKVDVVFIQFGRAEALDRAERLQEFIAAYSMLLDDWAVLEATLVLVTPPPYEDGEGATPKLSQRNPNLAHYAAAIRELAHSRSLRCVDLFTNATRDESRLTANGLQLTPAGHARLAAVVIQSLGIPDILGMDEFSPEGVWQNPAHEKLRQAVIAKNELWFHYWRPQNWAFLGGDRTEQPSSRDHRNPEQRWFPEEMKAYPPMIESREREIARLAARVKGGAQ